MAPKRRSGRRSSRGWRPTRRRTATAACRRAGPRTRGSAAGSAPAALQAEARPRRAQRGDDGGAGGAADGARLRLGASTGYPKRRSWEAQLARLAAYKAAHGDCNVPQGWAEDPRLGSWVSNQRTRKRKLDRGEPSEGMTAERAARLTALGFVWDPQRRHALAGEVGGAARAAGGLQGGARRLQRAAALGRGPAARQLGQQQRSASGSSTAASPARG